MTRNECEKSISEICEMCFKKHELEYGHQPINCAFREFDNEDCPTVKVLKDLIQEHFEEKAETNYEHFKDEVIENCNFAFALVDGKLHECSDVNCCDCGFSTGHGCSEKIKEWLKKPYKKPTYKLSQFEYDLLRTNNMSRNRKLSSFATYKNLGEIGYFKDIDFDLTINEILSNFEVKDRNEVKND